MNTIKIAAALRALADAFEDAPPVDNAHVAPGATPFTSTAPPAAPTAPKRGRGRPVAGEAPAAPVTAPAAPAPAEADPFAQPAPVAAVTPNVTQEEVRAALTALRAATSQDIAVSVLKTVGGVSSLPELPQSHYAAVKAAAEAKTAEYAKAPAVEVDPFETIAPTSITDPLPKPTPAVALTVEQVKAVITKAGSKVAQDTLMKIVMKHGGKAKNAETGVEGASLKALPVANYAAVVAEINALPNTKG